jgi:hypothetical protein
VRLANCRNALLSILTSFFPSHKMAMYTSGTATQGPFLRRFQAMGTAASIRWRGIRRMSVCLRRARMITRSEFGKRLYVHQSQNYEWQSSPAATERVRLDNNPMAIQWILIQQMGRGSMAKPTGRTNLWIP